VHVLAQESLDRGPQRERAVGGRVRARHVRADLDELLTSRRASISRRASRISARWSAVVIAPETRDTDCSTSIAGKCEAFASLRSSTMCPSRIERAVSAIGSLWSSPSTRTV
jgi:hypothetical protein